jgi:O-antigen ligase
VQVLTKLNTTKLLWAFAISQLLVISIYLGHRAETFVTFDHFLQSVKYSTLVLLVISILIAINQRDQLLKFGKTKFIFSAQILILYFTMIIHTDIKAINSPTILLMLILSLLIFTQPISVKEINKLVIFVAIINFILVVAQLTEVIPVAQDNVRVGLGIVSNRPTGFLFNAFAMSYASVITLLVCLYFLKKKSLMWLNWIGVISSGISVLFSGTRTPLLLILVFGLIIIVQYSSLVKKYWKIIVYFVSGALVLFPIFTILVGELTNRESLANLNGRTQLWTCVTSRWEEFIPFGVGVQAAFPNGFCSDDEWFSKLRHPENMFLLNYVEAGIIGFIGLVALFVIALINSAHALKKGSSLALGITGTFLLSSLFYVPLFHYLPFLEGRTANRGVFNFFFLTMIWMSILALTTAGKTQQQTRK